MFGGIGWKREGNFRVIYRRRRYTWYGWRANVTSLNEFWFIDLTKNGVCDCEWNEDSLESNCAEAYGNSNYVNRKLGATAMFNLTLVLVELWNVISIKRPWCMNSAR